MNGPESAYSVIDKAIRENRNGEILLYVFSVLVVGTGIFVIIYGALKGEGLVALSGGIVTSLIFPAFQRAAKIRKENMSIRLLEAPLIDAKTSEEAAKAINEFFKYTFTGTMRKVK